MDNQSETWKRCVAFHGHACPGLAIGVRACEAAARHLGITFSREEEVVCVAENDACGVDGVQVLTGCSVGKGNLLLRDRGKMAFSFFCRRTGESIRVIFKQNLNGTTMDRDTMQDYILTAPLADLFDIGKPSYSLPERARLFVGVICAQCGETCAEPAARLQNGQTVCLDCFSGYSRGW